MTPAAESQWTRILACARSARSDTSRPGPGPDDLDPLFRDCYRDIAVRRSLVLAQIGQSLDGRIATETGHSHTINGSHALDHLHRLRALMDAVVVGARTAIMDNPRLTTRRVPGPNPTRVIIDPCGRVPADCRLLSDDAAPTIVITGPGCVVPAPARHLALPASDRRISPRAILDALDGLELRRVMIEGGADTLSRFMDVGAVDQLHVMVAPLILGSGRPGLSLRPITRVQQALRLNVRSYRLGDDTLFTCTPDGRLAEAPGDPGGPPAG